jgi:hypothetical protein
VHLLSVWPIEVLTFGLVCLATGVIGAIPLGYWIAHQPVPCECQPHRDKRARLERAATRRLPPGGEGRH